MTSSTGTPSFNVIYKTYLPAITKYVNLKIRNREIAEELIEDIFIKAHQKLDTYNVQKAQFVTWLFNIAKNTVIDHFRKKMLDTTPLEIVKDYWATSTEEDQLMTLPIPTTDRNPLEAMISEETVYNVREAMSQLNEVQKELLTMFAIDNLTYEEIAEQMNMPMGTVKGTIFNARTKLKEILGSHPVLA